MKLYDLEKKAEETLKATKEEKAIRQIIIQKERIKQMEKALDEMKDKYGDLLRTDSEDIALNDFTY
jgi:hypothetical protein